MHAGTPDVSFAKTDLSGSGAASAVGVVKLRRNACACSRGLSSSALLGRFPARFGVIRASVIAAAICLTAPASAQMGVAQGAADNAEAAQARKALVVCLTNEAIRLDDKASDARTVAIGIVDLCDFEIRQVYMLSAGKLKLDAHILKQIDFEKERILGAAVATVLQVRAAARDSWTAPAKP